MASNKRPAEESNSDQVESSTKKQKTGKSPSNPVCIPAYSLVEHESTSAQATSSLATLAATLPAANASTTPAAGPSDNKSNDKAKRDRENTTMLVSNLPADTAEADLRKLFGDVSNLYCSARLQLMIYSAARFGKLSYSLKQASSLRPSNSRNEKASLWQRRRIRSVSESKKSKCRRFGKQLCSSRTFQKQQTTRLCGLCSSQ